MSRTGAEVELGLSRPEQKRRRVTWGRKCTSVEIPVVNILNLLPDHIVVEPHGKWPSLGRGDIFSNLCLRYGNHHTTSHTESSLLSDVFSSLSYPYLVMSFLSMFYGQPFGIHLSLHNMLQKRYITMESLVCHSTISSWCCIVPNSSSPVSHRNSGHISSQIESSGTANPAQLCPS